MRVDAEAAASRAVARESYGRLIARLATRTRDIAAAEDALADALVAALAQWPTSGVPERPDAWLVTAARRRWLDAQRRDAVRSREGEAVGHMLEALMGDALADAQPIPDDRLRLLFVCTHPAIDVGVQVPLMLQTVLGLEAADIASAMRVAPKTMGQRLWRAKTKIREAGIPFEVPALADVPERLDAVLEAIYAAFGTAWEDVRGGEVRLRDLTSEAIFLARALVRLLPREPEAHGLLALMLFADARRAARRTPDGTYVPLDRQDIAAWSRPALTEAERVLRQAFLLGRIGPFQIEAAIQSAHVSARLVGQRDHEGLIALYDGLVRLSPSLGALVARAAALIDGRGPELALAALDALDAALTRDYQPYWAVRAAALRAAGRQDAAEAYSRAIGLSEDEAVRRFLTAERAGL